MQCDGYSKAEKWYSLTSSMCVEVKAQRFYYLSSVAFLEDTVLLRVSCLTPQFRKKKLIKEKTFKYPSINSRYVYEQVSRDWFWGQNLCGFQKYNKIPHTPKWISQNVTMINVKCVPSVYVHLTQSRLSLWEAVLFKISSSAHLFTTDYVVHLVPF